MTMTPVQHLEQFQKQVFSLNLSNTGDYAKILDFLIKAYNLGYNDAENKYEALYPTEDT